MSISVKLEVFEGPLDLLLHLIDKNKVNIYDIPIIEITEQYIDYINDMKYKDLGSMSEFLVMASELLRIKSKMLLPKDEDDEDDEDPRYELVERLLEYKMFKYISNVLKDKEVNASKTIFKESTVPKEVYEFKEEVDPAQLTDGLSVMDIHKTFLSIMKKQKEKIDPIRSKFGDIEQEKVNMADKLNFIVNYTYDHKKYTFTDLLTDNISKQELIVTFLGVLELIKRGQVVIKQNKLFDDFIITRTDKAINKNEDSIQTEALLSEN